MEVRVLKIARLKTQPSTASFALAISWIYDLVPLDVYKIYSVIVAALVVAEIAIVVQVTNSMAYGILLFNTAFTRALQ